MLEAYLAFARGGLGEQSAETDMAEFLEELKADVERDGHRVNVAFHGPPIVTVRPAAFKRCLSNLVSNAARFAHTIFDHRSPRPPLADVHHRRRRPRHPARCFAEDLRALLHRPSRPGLRAEFRPRPVDLQADRRGTWRQHLGGESHGSRCCWQRTQSAGRPLHRAPAGKVTETPTIHASAVLIGTKAVLIRGPSGAGKIGTGLGIVRGRPRRGVALCSPGC